MKKAPQMAKKPNILQVAPIAKGISLLLSPYAEVVVHDLKRNQITLIENSFSKRKVGDLSDLESFDPDNESEVIGPYEKIDWNGRRIKSISIVHKDEKGKAVALICINLDVEDFAIASEAIQRFVLPVKKIEKPESLFRDDLLDRINEFVRDYAVEKGSRVEMLSKEQKGELVQRLRSTGAFEGRRAAEYVAKILNISRATVYNYLNLANPGKKR